MTQNSHTASIDCCGLVKKPPVQKQGTIVVERDDGGFLVMFPTGDVQSFTTKREVEAACKRWFKANVLDGSIGVGAIKWR